MNTEGYTCYVPRMGTDYRITPYSYITSFVCCHPEGSESKATRKIGEISEISVLQKKYHSHVSLWLRISDYLPLFPSMNSLWSTD